jgi:hypothetical protein
MLILTAPGKVYGFNVFHISSFVFEEAASEITVTLITGKSYVFGCNGTADFDKFAADCIRARKEAMSLFTRI